MNQLFSDLKKKGIKLPEDALDVLNNCRSFTVFNSVDELRIAALGGPDNSSYEVQYEIPGKGMYTEAIVHRVSNGVSANYTDPYMRRRDPDTMLIADDQPTDKETFKSRFNYDFSSLKKETFDWLKDQDLAVFFYFAGREGIGVSGMAIAPANAGFFAMGLAMLQVMLPVDELQENLVIDSVIYVAPTFRHTHFDGKQIVVHNREGNRHDIFSYNLYPGPSAKKGLYGALLTKGEKEGWITAHCSTVQAVSPYDNSTTFMHEGASGGGKSEMLQHILRETNGQVMIGQNINTGEKRLINLPLFSSFNPVTDDMAICHPSIKKDN